MLLTTSFDFFEKAMLRGINPGYWQKPQKLILNKIAYLGLAFALLFSQVYLNQHTLAHDNNAQATELCTLCIAGQNHDDFILPLPYLGSLNHSFMVYVTLSSLSLSLFSPSIIRLPPARAPPFSLY